MRGLWVYLLEFLWFTLWCFLSSPEARLSLSEHFKHGYIFICLFDMQENKKIKWSGRTLDWSFTLDKKRLHPCLQELSSGCSTPTLIFHCAGFVLSTIERASDNLYQRQHLFWLCVCVCVLVKERERERQMTRDLGHGFWVKAHLSD